MVLRNVIAVAVLLIASLCSAQKSAGWHVYEVEDFYFYYKGSKTKESIELDQRFSKELLAIQNQINYHLNGKIDVFLIEQSAEQVALEKEWEDAGGSDAGKVQDRTKHIVIQLYDEPRKQIQDFRSQAAVIVLYEMMYGESLQDQLRSANLLYLPEWVFSGLELYIGDEWSAETDNQWRMVFEQYGLDHFNTIPARYDALKGASFIKFIHDSYGQTAIPTLLYMSRLTRKFNSALFYSFQRTAKDLFEDWKLYYTAAYLKDQRKRLPVNGIQISQFETLDLMAVDGQHYYRLESSPKGIQLNLYEVDGEKKHIYTLGKDELPLKSFSGAIQKNNETLYLFVESLGKIKCVSWTNGNQGSHFLNIKSIQRIFSQNKQIYLLESGMFVSKLYLYNRNGLEKIQSFNYFVNDIALDGAAFICFTYDHLKKGSLVRISPADTLAMLNTTYEIRHMVMKGEELFYNMNRNGVFNGARFNLSSGKIDYLTDYRSDIAFHQWTDSLFAEFVLSLEHSSLFITDQINSSDFFVYDSLTSTYFNNYYPASKPIIVNEAYIQEQDSVPSWTFQSPIDPEHDFTVSNYDSLKELEELRQEEVSKIGIPKESFETKQFVLQLCNELMSYNDIPFQTGVKEYLPNKVGMRIGTRLVNQYNTKSFTLDYIAYRMLQQQDALMSYGNRTTRIPFNVNFAYRQRVGLLSEQEWSKYRSSTFGINWQIAKTNLLRLEHTLQYRYDNELHLGTSAESITTPGSTKSQIASSFRLRFETKEDKMSRDWHIDASINMEPYFMLNSEKLSAKNVLQASARKPLNRVLEIELYGSAGMSYGTNPTFFVLGGSRTDVFSNYQTRNFSDFKEAAYYSMVYGIRGFNVNYRNGTSFGVLNSQIAYSVFKHIMKRPLFPELINQLKLVAFADIGASMYEKSIYHEANALNTQTIYTPGGSYTIQVRNIKNPTIGSIGVGIHTSVYSYYLRSDLAFPIESAKVKNPMFHLSVGRYLP